MMEREINLLPPSVIFARSGRIYLKQAGRLLRFAIFLALLLLVAQGGVYLVAGRTPVATVPGIDEENNRQKDILLQVHQLNAQLAALKAWRTSNIPWTAQLPEVLRVMPTGVVLTGLGVNGENQVLELRGTFTRREELVAWQRQLAALPWVQGVESPLSNFATGSDVQFSLLVTRKK